MGWAFWWGVFPDLFAFVPIFVVSLYQRIVHGHTDLAKPPTGEFQPWTPGFDSMQNATQFLYQCSHSLVMFAAVFLLVWFLMGRPPWVIVPWAMHIMLDIPSHSYKFYPTPLFWPISNWKFLHGVSWGQWWMMALNYGALLIVFAILVYLPRR